MANTVDDTLAERGQRYGDFTNRAALSQALKEAVQSSPSWQRMTPWQREAVEMILHKISRIVYGDPNYSDSWHDIGGYSRLVEQALEYSPGATPPTPPTTPPRAVPPPAPAAAIPATPTPPSPPPVKIPDRPPGG